MDTKLFNEYNIKTITESSLLRVAKLNKLDSVMGFFLFNDE